MESSGLDISSCTVELEAPELTIYILLEYEDLNAPEPRCCYLARGVCKSQRKVSAAVSMCMYIQVCIYICIYMYVLGAVEIVTGTHVYVFTHGAAFEGPHIDGAFVSVRDVQHGTGAARVIIYI